MFAFRKYVNPGAIAWQEKEEEEGKEEEVE
jgi:hypothetical protein